MADRLYRLAIYICMDGHSSRFSLSVVSVAELLGYLNILRNSVGCVRVPVQAAIYGGSSTLAS